MMNKIQYKLLGILFVLCTTHASAFAASTSVPQWITAFEDQSQTNTWLCFRKDFHVDSLPTTIATRIAVDSKYWLWVNGEMIVFEGGVKRGPTPKDSYFDQFDLASYLVEGHNSVAILVWYYGKQGFSHNPSGQAGLFFDAKGDNGFTLVSDQTWRASPHPSYYTATDPLPNFRLPESSIGFDANKDIDGWNAKVAAELKWPSVRLLGYEGNPCYGQLYDRLIPQWKNTGVIDYLSVERRKGFTHDTIVARLPYNAHITPYFSLSEAKGGERIRMQTDHFLGGGHPNVYAEYVAKSGEQSYESLGWMNGHEVYYIIDKSIEEIQVKYRETSYDTEFTGAFTCSDMFFNRYWEKSRRTLMVTMRDSYMDCPDRERALWWGDAVNESGEAFYALCPKSHLLMKKCMYELIGWQRPDGALYSPVPSTNWDKELPGQMLASIGHYGFWNYYLCTGDLEPIRDLYDGVVRYLAIWKVMADGTIQPRTTAWNWGDWGVNIDRVGLYNAWYYLALRGVAQMAEVLGLGGDCSRFEQQMAHLKVAFQKKFWDGIAYRTPSFSHYPYDDRLQALAVVAGLVDEAKYPKLLQVMKTTEYASPYMEKYVTEALFMMGEGEFGLDRMKRRFAQMVNDTTCSTLYEGWGVGKEGFGGGTKNHAWSGGGLTILAQYVCGIAPTKPGYAEFSVLPQPAGLRKASSRVHTVKGFIETSFELDPDRFRMQVVIPENTRAVVGIPSEYTRVECNRKQMKSYKIDAKFTYYTLDPGTYSFTAH